MYGVKENWGNNAEGKVVVTPATVTLRLIFEIGQSTGRVESMGGDVCSLRST